MGIHHKKPAQIPPILSSRQTTLDEIGGTPAKTKPSLEKGTKYQFIDRFPPIPATTYEDYCEPLGMDAEWVYYQEIPSYKGLFQDMIALNSFDYWEGIQKELKAKNFRTKGFNVQEFVKWEFLRHSKGIRFFTRFTAFWKEVDKSLLEGTFDNPSQAPEAHHCSYMYKWLTVRHFKGFFISLVQECIATGLIIPRIAIADGFFMKSWAGNFTKDKDGNPTDPEATITVHSKKYYGKGYTSIVFIAWCGNRWLPVWCKTCTGSISENKAFKGIVGEFLKEMPYDWKIMEYDRGADAKDNRDFLQERGLIGVIGARKNITYDELVDLGNGKLFCKSDIPEGMGTSKFKRLSDHRAQAECPFSPIKQVFNMKELNSMGLKSASILMYKALSLQLLHALSAYKLNRPDLLMSASAFTALKP